MFIYVFCILFVLEGVVICGFELFLIWNSLPSLRHDGSFWTLNMMGKIINSSSSSSHSFIPWHKIKVGWATKTSLFPAFSLTSWYSHVYGCQRPKKLLSEDVICLEVLNLLITMQTRGFGPPRETQEKSRVVSNLTKNLNFAWMGSW